MKQCASEEELKLTRVWAHSLHITKVLKRHEQPL